MNELKKYINWVVTNPHDKIPLNPYTGRNADVTNSATWADFGTADAVVSSNKQLLLGFVLTGTPFSCVDLDTHKTKDASIIKYHHELYDAFDTYSELSPNDGVHLWCEGKLTVDGKRLPQQFVEVYCERRYITITGKSLNDKPIENRQKELNEFIIWATQQQRSHVTQPNSSPEVNTDDEICVMAANAFNGELFKQLYIGNWEGRYSTQSEADQALCNVIAFYTDSKEQTARIFHNSQLGKRKKAHRLDYLYDLGYGLITRAFDQKLPNIRFGDLDNIIKNKIGEETLKAIAAPVTALVEQCGEIETLVSKKIKQLPEFITDELELNFDEFPSGLTGEIAKFIYMNAYRPVKEVAIAGAVAFMAGICGRFYNISSMGLNHYIAILAPTGTGKEAASIGIDRLRSFVEIEVPEFKKFTGPDSIASSQALMRHLANESPCCVSRVSEMGIWLSRLCNRKASEHLIGLRGKLLDLYTRSGWGQVVREEIRADSRKDTPAVMSPAFTMYGDTTPEVFYASLDEVQLDQGLISRFLVFECSADKNHMYNPNHGKIMPDMRMIQDISLLAKYALKGGGTLNQSIGMTDEAKEYLTDFRKECEGKLLEDSASAEAKVYTRGNERLLRLAGLIAVGNAVHSDLQTIDEPIITLPIAVWAKKLILRTMINVILKFERGEVGESNLYIEQRKAMISIIRKYWMHGYKPNLISTFNISKEMYDAKVITRNYMNTMIRGYGAFRRSRNMKMDFDNALIDLTKNGILIGPMEMAKVKESMRSGHCYYIHDFEMLNRGD